MLTALHYLYPENGYIRLAAVKAFLQNRDGEVSGYGVRMMEEGLKSGLFPQEAHVLHERIPSLRTAIYPSAFKDSNSSQLAEFHWKTPAAFRGSESLVSEIPNYVALTHMVSGSGTGPRHI